MSNCEEEREEKEEKEEKEYFATVSVTLKITHLGDTEMTTEEVEVAGETALSYAYTELNSGDIVEVENSEFNWEHDND